MTSYEENEALEVFEPVREALFPVLDPFLRPLGGYAIGSTGPDQYVGSVYMDEEDLEKVILSIGFTLNYGAALKHRVAPDSSDIEDGSYAWRKSYFAKYQIHLMYYLEDKGEIRLYAHKEYNWHRYPIKHIKTVYFNTVKARNFVKKALSKHRVEVVVNA